MKIKGLGCSSHVGMSSPILYIYYVSPPYAGPGAAQPNKKNPNPRLLARHGAAQSPTRAIIKGSILLISLARLALLFHQLEVFLAQHEAVAEVFLTHYLVCGKLLGAALEEDAPLEE